MTVADIAFLFAYTESANEQIFDAAAALSHEQTTRAVGGSFPSIRETLYRKFEHMLLESADLDREISFTRINGDADRAKLGFLLLHVANHATYHRGQVASQIRMVGGVPPSTDLLRFRP